MDLVAYQRAHRQSEIGLGAIFVPEAMKKTKGLGMLAAIMGGGGRGGPVVAPPPVSPYWKPVGNQSAFWAVSLMDPAFRAAYNASRETVAQGGRGTILWRTWAYQGIWYATSRSSTGQSPTLYQFRPPPGAAGAGRTPYDHLRNAPGHGSNAPEGMGDIQSRIAAYLDEHGMLDGVSLGYDLGIGQLPTLDMSRWAAIPTTPAADNPNWRAMAPGELSRLGAARGWTEAVSAAESRGTPIFKFEGSWYKLLPGTQGFQVLGGGSGSGGHRYMAGVARQHLFLGASKPNFYTPSAAQWSANPPGTAVSDAAVALLTYFQNSGTPYEGTPVTVVGTFQAAYNSETAVTALGSTDALLDTDEKYGPNTKAALQSIIDAGGSTATAPAVNTTAPSSAPTPTPTPTPTTAPADYTIPIVVGAVATGAALIGGSWWLATQRVKRRRTAYA